MEKKEKKLNTLKLLKDNLSLELILVIALFVTDSWGYQMYNAIQTKYAVNTLTIGAAVIGVIGSLYLFSGLIFRLPSSNLMYRVNLRVLLITCFVIKAAVYALTAFVPVESVVLYGLLRCIYALCWSFMGVALPAMLSISVDKRLIGTAFALYSGLSGMLISPAAPLSVTLLGKIGSKAFFVIAALTIVPIILAMFVRDDKFRAKMADDVQDSKNSAGAPKRKSKFEFKWAFLPICIFASLPLWTWSMYNDFLHIHAENVGFVYLTAFGMATAIGGAMNLIGGILCDIINPGIVAIVQCILWGAAMFLIGGANANTNMYPIFIMYGLGIGALGCIRIACMKAVSPKDRINMSGTYSLSNDCLLYTSPSPRD